MVKLSKKMSKTQPKAKGKILHPASREAKRQSRGMIRKEKLILTKVAHNKLEKRKCDTMYWFRTAMDEDKKSYTEAEMCELVRLYIARHDDEITQIRAGHRKGEAPKGPKANREMVLNLCQQEERQLLTGHGFEAPDLLSEAKTKSWLAWDGSLRYLDRLPVRRYIQGAASHAVECMSSALSASSKWNGKDKFVLK
eukprot:CFRG3120T1